MYVGEQARLAEPGGRDQVHLDHLPGTGGRPCLHDGRELLLASDELGDERRGASVRSHAGLGRRSVD
jgi:hypothetical protein